MCDLDADLFTSELKSIPRGRWVMKPEFFAPQHDVMVNRSPATRRYCDNPLIVQGPGAGPEVTAGGVFADLLRVAAYLGARL